MAACTLLVGWGWVGEVRAGLPEPWRFVTALPQGNDLLAAWSPGGERLVTGGHGGVILRWDGSEWRREPTPTQKTVFAIHGLSPTDIWAVGGDPYTDVRTNRSLILHYDGVSWREMAAPRFGEETYSINAVHAVSANDVWATQDGGTYLMHYDGRVWDWVTVPLPVEGTFRAVTSSGADHVYVAGTHGQVLHRDRGVWKLERKTESGNFSSGILSALWAYSPEHVYAVGNWTTFLKRQGDGTWSALPVQPSQVFGFGFLNVWGTSPTNVFFCDVQGIFRSDGSSPATRASYELGMRRQWYAACGAGDRLFGVGPAGVAHEYRLGSDQKTGVLSPLTVGGGGELALVMRGAAACGADGVLVHGSSYAQPNASPLWYVLDGVPWRWPAMPPGVNADVEFRAVTATGPTNVLVSWENLLDPGRGVHRWDGKVWTAVPGAEGTVAFARSPGGRLWAVSPWRVQAGNGVDGWIDSYTLPFEQMDTVLSSVWARSDTEVYVGTRNGRVLRYDGALWRWETTPSASAIVGLAGFGVETYAVGENGAAWRRVGSAWQPVAGVVVRAEEHFTAVVAGADGVYAAQRTPGRYTGGGLGRVWRLAGASATLVIQGLSQPLEALIRTGEGHLVGIAPRDFMVTTAPATGAPTLKRIDLGKAGWQSVGDTGVELAVVDPVPMRPMVGVRRWDRPVPFAGVDGGPSGDHGQHWVLLEDRYHAGSAVPPLRVRVTYDPARLAPGMAGEVPGLYRTDGAMAEVASGWDPVAHTLTSVGPVDFQVLTLARVTAPPSLRVGVGLAGQVTLSWPATAAGYGLESATDLGPGAVWVAVKAVGVTQGEWQSVTVEAGDSRRFFRLSR